MILSLTTLTLQIPGHHVSPEESLEQVQDQGDHHYHVDPQHHPRHPHGHRLQINGKKVENSFKILFFTLTQLVEKLCIVLVIFGIIYLDMTTIQIIFHLTNELWRME